MVQPIPFGKAGYEDVMIEPKDIFQQYPWDGLMNSITNTFEIFGRWCSICIGVLTIMSIIKNGLVYLRGCCLVRRYYGNKDTARYAVSPLYFILGQMRNENKTANPKQYKKAPTAPDEGVEILPMTDSHRTEQQLKEIRELSKLPIYMK